jgi:AcrR family transcriptional regulator
VVAYHFGSKEGLAQAIFEHRLPSLEARRAELERERVPHDLRARLECYVLPILEQGELQGSHYLGFVAMLQQDGHGDVFDRVPDEYQASTQAFRDHVSALLPDVPEPVRSHRLTLALTYSVHAAAARARELANGHDVQSFAVHVGDLLDGLAGLLEAPVSRETAAALGMVGTRSA